MKRSSEVLCKHALMSKKKRNSKSETMRVKSIQNIDGFFRALEKCHGRVELITDVKDVLNLASKLT